MAGGRVCAVHSFPVAYVPPHLRRKSNDYQRRDDFGRQDGGGRAHGQWKSYGEFRGRSGVGEGRVVSWEEWGGRGVCHECHGRSGVGEGRFMSAWLPHVVSVLAVTAVDQKERYGGGGYGGRHSSQDSGGWWWRDRDGPRDGSGRGRDVDYEQRHSEGYGKRGGYPRWGGERREDDARPPRSVDWNVLLPPNDRVEK